MTSQNCNEIFDTATITSSSRNSWNSSGVGRVWNKRIRKDAVTQYLEGALHKDVEDREGYSNPVPDRRRLTRGCLESWSLFMLVENQENQEDGWKSKEIVEMHAKRKNGNKRLLKSGFYCLKKVRRWFFKIRVIWMKVILKTKFKTCKITGKTRGCRRNRVVCTRVAMSEWGLGVWLWLHCWWLCEETSVHCRHDWKRTDRIHFRVHVHWVWVYNFDR